ncbi:MAG: hypothetical protein ACJATF_002687, partial [Flavobacteriales bacterium]
NTKLLPIFENHNKSKYYDKTVLQINIANSNSKSRTRKNEKNRKTSNYEYCLTIIMQIQWLDVNCIKAGGFVKSLKTLSITQKIISRFLSWKRLYKSPSLWSF